MYKTKVCNKVYEKIFNMLALSSLGEFLSRFSESDQLEFLFSCYTEYNNKEFLDKALTILEEHKSDYIVYAPKRLLHFQELSEEENYEIYKETLKVLLSDEMIIPGYKISECIKKCFENEFNYIDELYNENLIKNTKDLKEHLNSVAIKNPIQTSYEEISDFIDEKIASGLTAEKIIEMFTSENLILEGMHC